MRILIYLNWSSLGNICKRLLHASISASINLDHISDLKLIWPLKNEESAVVVLEVVLGCLFMYFSFPNVLFSMMMDQHKGYGKDENTANRNPDFLLYHCFRIYIV